MNFLSKEWEDPRSVTVYFGSAPTLITHVISIKERTDHSFVIDRINGSVIVINNNYSWIEIHGDE